MASERLGQQAAPICSVAFAGCVHVLLEVRLRPEAEAGHGDRIPAPASPAAEPAAGSGSSASPSGSAVDSSAGSDDHDGVALILECRNAAPGYMQQLLEQAIAAALQELQQQELPAGQQPEVQVAVLPLAVPAVSTTAAGDAGSMWQTGLPWASLVSPVCFPCPIPAAQSSAAADITSGAGLSGSAAASPLQQVQVGVLGSDRLPDQPRVVVLVQAAGPASGPPGGATCHLLDSCQVWAAGPAAGRSHVIMYIPTSQQPAVITLHLRPQAPAGSGSTQARGTAVHPLASLPLLCLPQAAADEVLHMHAAAVGDMLAESWAAGAGAAAGSSAGGTAAEPLAAREAYWGHYVPFVSSWSNLLALVAGRTADDATGGSPTVQALLADVACLLAYLSDSGMPACFEVAAQLLEPLALQQPQVWQQLLRQLQSLQQPLAMAFGPAALEAGTTGQSDQQDSAAVEHAELAGQGTAGAAGGTAAAGQGEGSDQATASKAASRSSSTEDSRRPQLHHRSIQPGTASSASNTEAGSGDGRAGREVGSPGQGAAGSGVGGKAASAMLPGCTATPGPGRGMSAVLQGYQDGSREAAYLRYKDACCLSLWDPVAAVVSAACTAVVFKGVGWQGLVGGTPAGRAWWQQQHSLERATILLGCALGNLPFLVLLMHRRWYQQHREGVILYLGGAGRVVLALGHGVLSALTGCDHCQLVQNCWLVLLFMCTVHFPLTQQVRFRKVWRLTLLDAVGAGCYAGFKAQSWVLGAVAGAAACAAGLMVSAGIEWRCRTGFEAHGQQVPHSVVIQSIILHPSTAELPMPSIVV